MKNKIIKIVVVVLVLIGIFVGYQKVTASQANQKVETVSVKRGDLREALTISGEIDATEKATLRFQTSGLLSWVGVKEGDYVKKYQGIAALDQREVRKTLDKYLQSYMTSRWDFETTKDASGNSGAMTTAVRRVLEKAQFDLNSAVLDVELKDLAIQFSNLWTPIDGLVVRAESPVAGVNITPTQAEFDVVNPKTVVFIATADQTEVPKISQGMSGELVLDAFPGQTFPGQVETIAFSPKSGETGTVYAVKFNFSPDNAEYRYRLGMTGDLTFVTKEKKNVLYLPNKFVKTDSGKKYVNVFKNDKKTKTFVQTGLETDDSTEIISGLIQGDIISE